MKLKVNDVVYHKYYNSYGRVTEVKNSFVRVKFGEDNHTNIFWKSALMFYIEKVPKEVWNSTLYKLMREGNTHD